MMAIPKELEWGRGIRDVYGGDVEVSVSLTKTGKYVVCEKPDERSPNFSCSPPVVTFDERDVARFPLDVQTPMQNILLVIGKLANGLTVRTSAVSVLEAYIGSVLRPQTVNWPDVVRPK